MKKILVCLILALLLTALAAVALAGSNPLVVAAEGEGVPVYATSGGRRSVGVLYNGYTNELSLNDTNGRYSCYLTEDTTVWLNAAKAEKLLPGGVDSPRDANADQVPCNCFLAEVVTDGAKMWTGTGHKRVLAEHKAGTLVLVCGAFGKDYFVEGAGQGFMAQSALRKVQDVTFPDTGWSDYRLPGLETATVYLDGGKIPLASSATGVCGYGSSAMLKDGDALIILRDLGDWAQVVVSTTYGGGWRGFVEKRYLDPAGDHTPPTAVVTTDHPLNRLNVRDSAGKSGEVEIKLCTGVRVQVAAASNDWTEIALFAETGRWSVTGFVKSSYLVTGAEAETVESACVRVRLLREYKTGGDAGTLAAGTEGTVIGVYDGKYNRFAVRLEDGQIVVIQDNGTDPVLEPVDPVVRTAKTTKALTLRSGPNSGSEKRRMVKSGTTVEVLLRGENWALVRVGDDVGYVLSSGLKPKK